ncbi:glycosyltransferase [uncultured Pontibacter sp.]|uniref:glycosyltransferase n=1 Tax=uncultured Pontibacter sp. TaxID=453356 RepID=UPI002609316F|nr:glycosyltransferase [uncultured Pontibacter sp.]
MSLAPIVLFVYSRLTETKKTVQALSNNFLASESQLYIISDGPKSSQDYVKVQHVREYVKTITGFKEIHIIEWNRNKGLADSVIDGISQVLQNHYSIIVLEDDLVTTPNFLDFMNQALIYYKCNNRVQSISGYSLDINVNQAFTSVYFHTRTFPWGWATWQNRWNPEVFNKQKLRNLITTKELNLNLFKKKCGADVEGMLIASLEGLNNSWYIRWVLSHYLNDRLCVFPFKSKVSNIGHVENATHCVGINTYQSSLDEDFSRAFNFEVPISDDEINYEFLKYFSFYHKLSFRLKLMKSKKGRTMLLNEIINRVRK